MCLSMTACGTINATEYYAAMKKEQADETYNNRGKFQERWANHKKTGTKDYILHNSIHATFQKKRNCKAGRRQTSVCQGLGEEKVKDKGIQKNFGGEGNVRNLDCGGGYTAIHTCQTH